MDHLVLFRRLLCVVFFFGLWILMFVYAGAVAAAQMRARRCGGRRGGGLWREGGGAWHDKKSVAKPVAGDFKKDTPQNRGTFRECLGRLTHFFCFVPSPLREGSFFTRACSGAKHPCISSKKVFRFLWFLSSPL
jgi:hypothetical protein